jgi:small subunit ribosomal protein S15
MSASAAAAPSTPSTASSTSASAGAASTAFRRPGDVPAATEQRINGMFYDADLKLSRRQKQVFARIDDEPPLRTPAEHGLLYGLQGKDVEDRSPMVARAVSTRTGNVASLRKFRKAELVKKFGLSPLDTGNSRVQVGMLTDTISRLSAHLASNKHDTHCKRQLQIFTSRRRKLLQYMIRTDYQGYRLVVRELGLRPMAVVASRHPPKQRAETHQALNERNSRLKNRRSRGHLGH